MNLLYDKILNKVFHQRQMKFFFNILEWKCFSKYVSCDQLFSDNDGRHLL